jgi:hypothetical protein
MGRAAAALYVAVASRVLVAASSNGPGGDLTGSEIVPQWVYMQNLGRPLLACSAMMAITWDRFP